jgi:hypothetical protein
LGEIALIIDNNETSSRKAVSFLKLGGYEPIVKLSILEGLNLLKSIMKRTVWS